MPWLRVRCPRGCLRGLEALGVLPMQSQQSSQQQSQQLSPEKFIQIGMGFWPAKALMSAVELGVCTELAKGEKTVDQLTNALKLNGRGVRDFLDALVALGVIDRTGDVYRNTREADFFLDKSKPSYMGGIIEMSG